MTDDRLVRALLKRAAELPDNIQPSVEHLVQTARRTRYLRFAGTLATVVVLVAAAFVLPPSLRSLLSGVSGSSSYNQGPSQLSAFDLAASSWHPLASSPLGARSKPILVWTGSKLLELGGNKNGATRNDGAVFDPGTGRWTLISPLKANVGFSRAIDVWTGRELFVTNGQTAPCPSSAPVSECLPHAGLYNPATNRWTTTLLPSQLEGFHLAGAAWNGREVVVAGTSSSPARLRVAAYTPATGGWRMISPQVPRGHPPLSAAIVATPTRVLLWSLWSRVGKTSKRSSGLIYGVDVLALASDGRWTNITGNWPQGQTVESPSYANGQILGVSEIWCGLCSPPAITPHPFLADAATLTRTEPSEFPRRPGAIGSFWLWNGRAFLTGNFAVTGKVAGSLGPLRWLAAYDPPDRRWYRLSRPPGKPSLGANPIFAGDQLLALTSSGALLSLHPMYQ
ncbi:MAG: hypothetical protein LBV34_07030 [Nocardiopsaceae bacterium]|jgi:hypothetical protein|nr:hypothetical protein [Nocardiopsaceae bacterium]